MSGPVDIEAVAAMLADRIEALARELLPLGRRRGREWVEASRDQGGLGDSLTVRLTAPRRGVWGHFAAGVSGDALDLIAYVACNGDKARALAWARAWLGIEGADPKALAGARRQAAAARDAAEREAAEEDAARSRRAQALWLSGAENLRGSAAGAYLAGRGIDLAALGRQPRALRAHPACLHGPSGRRFPALLAAVTGADGRFLAVHRTFLAPAGASGGGVIVKAPVADAKLSLGPVKGGVVRIWRGASGRPLAQAPAEESVVVTEGIEDALSVAVAAPQFRVLCAVSLANLAHLDLPPIDGGRRIVVVADNDAADSPAAAALDRAVRALLSRGYEVRIGHPPAGVKDVNQLLIQGRGGAR